MKKMRSKVLEVRTVFECATLMLEKMHNNLPLSFTNYSPTHHLQSKNHININLSNNDMSNFFDFHFMAHSNMFFRALHDYALRLVEKSNINTKSQNVIIRYFQPF